MSTAATDDSRAGDDPAEAVRFSLVVPVWNEGPNIGRFCAAAVRTLGRSGYELLLCYDRDDDDTLPTVFNLQEIVRPATIRPVKNTLGRGVRYAIEQGMRAARAPVVIVMMADASDDFETVPKLLHQVEAGAAVACGSRYCRGGRQIGGPWLKRTLSRLAGTSLHHLVGLPTHDVTNSFKAYSKAFLDCTPIESTAGFCLGMELTVKAFIAGETVTETPTTWRDRSYGESRFRLFRWLPTYWQWYWFALRMSAGRRKRPSR